MGSPEVSTEELKKDVDAYIQTGGNRSEAARLRKLPRKTYTHRLALAETQLGIQLGKIVDGRVDYVRAVKRPLPKGKGVARYILSSCQNNTHPHKAGLKNLLAYRDWLDKRAGDSCELILGTFTYAIDAYGAKAVKRGSYRPQDKLWYAPELLPFIKDESIQLAPGLIWCGEMNILPTATNPLSKLDDYNGRASNIVPHAKHAMESVASLADEATKFNYSTGAITLRNYIQKRVGIVAERKHAYGALIVEVDGQGNWYVRQLQVGDEGEVYDIGPRGYAGVKVVNGKVEARANTDAANSYVEAITWGDIHAAEMELWIRELGWGEGGLLDQVVPRKQFMHDVFSMRSRGHHELKNFHRTFEKFVTGEGIVQDEMRVTADFVKEACREWCETIVVRSNHDRHLDRWLNEANPALDPPNARYFMTLQARLLGAIEQGDQDFNILEYALREEGIPAGVLFLGEDESYVICKEHDGGIECGLHGDLGVNGARGSTQVLMKLGRRVNKNHDHIATIRGGVFSGGACSLNFPYMKGPNAHSVSHTLTFTNGARQILTFWNGKFRA